jgi:hypothetical protein
MHVRTLLVASSALIISACVHYPAGPSVMVLPGTGKDFTNFQHDDAMCRDWAGYQSEPGAQNAAENAGVGAAAVGTVVGAAAGAASGAAAGDPGAGAAIGAGSGLLLGTAAGAQRADYAGRTLQGRYDDAYLQCMYASGNKIPVPRGSFSEPSSSTAQARPRIPPPPRSGPPPPPPPY